MGLREYERKRDFTLTPEPSGKKRGARARKPASKLSFVVQKHAASRLHYDFRLELDGVLVSWAVPKGPSLDPADKRLAVHVEDHPLDYGGFEGTIPKGQYGGGSVIVWDRGRWTPDGDAVEGLRRGKLDFSLHGKKLNGAWHMVRLRDRNGSEDNWLLMKRNDEFAHSGKSITDARPESVKTGRMIEDIGARSKVWNSNRDGGDAQPRTRSSKAAAGRKRVTKTRSSAKKSSAAKPGSRKRKAGAASARTSAAKSVTLRTSRARRARASSLQARTRKKAPARSKRIAPRALAAALAYARPSEMPEFVEPQLATLESESPAGDGWVHELKFDGYRMQARLERGRVTWFSRNGLDWTARFQALSPAIAALPAKSALIDGEVVVLGADGVSHFQDLQQALSESDGGAFVYFAFDLLHVDGLDVRRCGLADRKDVLRALLARSPRKAPIRFSDHLVGGGPEFYAGACHRHLEGIVSKRIDGGYVSGRTRDWVKVKCSLRQEFVVAGFTQPSGSRVGFGSLVLGVHEKGKFRHAGRVGTGFGRALLVKLAKRLEALRIERPPFDAPVDANARRGVTWVEPRIVVEVAFTGWTSDGLLRHPSFQGLREDKGPEEVVKEVPRSAPGDMPGRTPARHPAKQNVAAQHVATQDITAQKGARKSSGTTNVTAAKQPKRKSSRKGRR